MSLHLQMQQREIPAALLAPDPVTAMVADRSSREWQRLRAAVGGGHAPYVDADRHTDDVWITLYGPRGLTR